jgi:catalase
MANAKKNPVKSSKIQDLSKDTLDGTNKKMTTDLGVPINDDHNTLKAGSRGPTLLQDFIFREKIQHFDRERIPERVVHARGSAAHGVFKLYKPLQKYTKAHFLNDTSSETPVFVRFSTVAGFRGSTDTARDVRGFAVKFYTQEGNYDLVGNNIPVFFIQDAMKFPDLVHSVKPEADNEMPQAGSAHDTFWDFISLSPETTHMIMWTMSDRAIPRSLRMMEGFGVHTFRLVNEKHESFFVKFHWKPVLGIHSLCWDEAQRISGKNSDFHRLDLWEAIEAGNFPEWELGLQIIPEKDEHKFDFDLLDPTKLVPEELVPVQIVGKMTLNRNPDNFFAETEQVAFNPGNVVPGIDFTNDPLLQGRVLSYTDTHIHRLGTHNFSQIPINRPITEAHNNHRDGQMQTHIPKGKAIYSPSTVGGGCPFQAKAAEGGYVTYNQKVEGEVIRARSKSFFDHFSQAKLFYQSQSGPEQLHIQNALSFELSKLKDPAIRQRMINTLTNVDMELAQYVAKKLGLPKPTKAVKIENHQVPADGKPANYASVKKDPNPDKSSALSMANQKFDTIHTRCIAVLISDGVDAGSIKKIKAGIEAAGGKIKIIADRLGSINGIAVDETYFNTASVLFDAVYIPGNDKHAQKLSEIPEAVHFVNEQYKHCKAIGLDADCEAFLHATQVEADKHVIVNGNISEFIKAIAKHRIWEREAERKVPA